MDYDFDMVKAFNSTTMERLDGKNQHNIHTWKSKILKWSNTHLIHALTEVAPHTDDSAIAVAREQSSTRCLMDKKVITDSNRFY